MDADGAFVVRVEQPPRGCHRGGHAHVRLVAAAPSGRAVPLKARGRRDAAVSRNGIAGGAVQVVRPLVHVAGPGFDDRLAADQRDAAGDEHAKQFLARRPRPVARRDDDVHHVARVRQAGAVEWLHRDRSVEPELLEASAGLADGRGVRIEAMDAEAVARANRRRQLPAAAAEMDDQPADESPVSTGLLDPCRDIPCPGRNSASDQQHEQSNPGSHDGVSFCRRSAGAGSTGMARAAGREIAGRMDDLLMVLSPVAVHSKRSCVRS